MIKKEETSLTIDGYLKEYSAITNKRYYGKHEDRYTFAVPLIKDTDVVLDAGCGEGFGAKMLSERAAKVYGVDYHAQVVEHASKKYSDERERLVFKAGDCYDLDFDDGYFDVICAFDLIEHLTDEDAFLIKMQRLLKGNGKLIISTPNKIIHLVQLGKIYAFHHKEYFYGDFTELLSRYFKDIKVYIQSPQELYDVIAFKRLLFSRVGSVTPEFIKKNIKKALHLLGGGRSTYDGRSKSVIRAPEDATEISTCSDFIAVATKRQ